jgi:hypothetical protein
VDKRFLSIEHISQNRLGTRYLKSYRREGPQLIDLPLGISAGSFEALLADLHL